VISAQMRVGVGLQQLLELAHHAGALERRRVAPGREGLLREATAASTVACVGQQHAAG
jgi:hypothetical protein